ncbi:MAG: hypothetical protein U0Y68_10880 [Blastocatellia bacterium]
MNLFRWLFIGCFVLVLAGCRARTVTSSAPAVAPAAERTIAHQEIGFRSRRNLEEHYAKHGSEFGGISQTDYLRLAQSLRDAPAGGDILEAVRSADSITTRFDRKTGAFLAFNEDLTIRTFFKPNDGERYFKRQLQREH